MKVRGGFALIATLWLVVVLSAVSLDLSLRGRAWRLAGANGLEADRARGAAEAGIEHVRSRLAAALGGGVGPDPSFDPSLVLGTLLSDTVAIGDLRYAIEVRDPAARVNVNTADENQLRELLRALRIDYGDADRIAQAAMDWRDPDDEHRARGAEREAYLRDGLPVLPRNGPFQDADELRYVRGVTPPVFDRIRPYLTVQGNGLINVNSAPEPVLRSVPGMTSGAARAIVRLRATGLPIRRMQELTDALPPLERELLLSRAESFLRSITFETRALEVVSVGWVEGSPVRSTATAMVGWGGTSVAVGWKTFR